MTGFALVVNVASTLALIGLIWTVQLCLYPLFRFVPEPHFRAYHQQHSRNITILVGPLMLAELMSAILLAVWPPAEMGRWPFTCGLALVLLVWASTAFVQVPLHGDLGAGFSASAHRRLVSTNWVRTILWTARGVLLGWVALQLARVSI